MEPKTAPFQEKKDRRKKRVLGFDYGLKRIGTASGNSVTGTCQGLMTVSARDGVPDWSVITRLIDEWKPGQLVVGLPLSMEGDETDMSRSARGFGAMLAAKSGLDVCFVDERLTSMTADHLLQESGRPGKSQRKRHKTARDNLAAELILQTYFDDNQGMGGAINIERVIKEMAERIAALDLSNPLLIGIHTGGVWVASHLQRELNISSRLGMLDISFYRDDFTRVGLHPEVKSSELPDPVEGRNVILVDDVLYSGRTVRAAMNEIFSYGRPSRVTLAVLIERPGRELPIQPDIVGSRLVLDDNEQAKLTCRNGSLKLNIIRPGNTHESP